MKVWWCFAAFALSLPLRAQTPPSQGSDPALHPAAVDKKPAGKPAGTRPERGSITEIADSEVKPVLLAMPDCTSYSATPLETPILAFEKHIYFTSGKLPSDPGGANTYLMEFDRAESRVKRVAGFKAGRFLSLKPQGTDQDVLSLFDFSTGKPQCGEGLTSGISIKPQEQKVTPSFPLANYAIVAGDLSTYLAETDKGLIQQVDLVTGQRRTLERFAKGMRPLFLKSSPPTVIYSYNPQSRELAKFVASKKKADAILKLKEGMRLVRDEDKFAIVQPKGNDLQLVQLKDWSGSESKSQDLPLPAGFQAANLAVKASFAGNKTVVYGKDDPIRRSLKSALIFEGGNAKVLKSPDAQSYFSAVELLKDGTVVLLLSELDSGAVREMWLADGSGEPRKIDVLKSKKSAKTKMR